MNELSLFDTPVPFRADPPAKRVPVRAHERVVRARRTDPQTSHDAAAAVTPTAGATEARILDAYRMYGPMTDEVLVSRVAGRDGTIVSARGRLKGRGLVVFAGYKLPSTSGCPMNVWRLA